MIIRRIGTACRADTAYGQHHDFSSGHADSYMSLALAFSFRLVFTGALAQRSDRVRSCTLSKNDLEPDGFYCMHYGLLAPNMTSVLQLPRAKLESVSRTEAVLV